MIFLCVLSSSLAEQADTSRMYAIASRPFLAETFEELIEASEVVLIGQVVSQRPEIRHDLVFTYSSVRVNQIVTGSLAEPAAMIDVLQTGGSANGMYTPALADEPLMHIGEAYLLCLTYAPEDGQYQAYYLPTGGGQGILPFTDIAQASQPTQSAASAELAGADTALAQVLARAEAVFAGRDYGCCEVMGGSFGDSGDPKNGGHWPAHTAEYYVYGSSSLSVTERTRIRQAFSSWTVSEFSFTQASSALDPEISFFQNDYGATDWEARTSFKMGEYAEYTTDHNNIKGEFYRVNIQVNEYLIENYTGARILGIITHEAGHALGLAHVNPSVNPNSVMVSASSSRTNVSPTNFDKGIVSEIYSGHSH